MPGYTVLEARPLAAMEAGDDGVLRPRVVDLTGATASGAPDEVLSLGHGRSQRQLLISEAG